MTYVALLMVIALITAAAATEQWMFWIAGSLFGISLGAIWVTSRTYIIELSPKKNKVNFSAYLHSQEKFLLLLDQPSMVPLPLCYVLKVLLPVGLLYYH